MSILWGAYRFTMSVLLHSRETRLAVDFECLGLPSGQEIYVLQIVEWDTTLSTRVSPKYVCFVYSKSCGYLAYRNAWNI
jgi:hypothetical protein